MRECGQRNSLVRLLARVHPRVSEEVAGEPEYLVAVLARQRLLHRVDLLVLAQVLSVGERLSAVAALLCTLERTECSLPFQAGELQDGLTP